MTKNSICIFCGRGQFSDIYKFFANKKGTVRPIVWEKTNPSPMNGQYVYLSGVEFAVWFKKAGAKVFNAHCKNTVFKYPKLFLCLLIFLFQSLLTKYVFYKTNLLYCFDIRLFAHLLSRNIF